MKNLCVTEAFRDWFLVYHSFIDAIYLLPLILSTAIVSFQGPSEAGKSRAKYFDKLNSLEYGNIWGITRDSQSDRSVQCACTFLFTVSEALGKGRLKI